MEIPRRDEYLTSRQLAADYLGDPAKHRTVDDWRRQRRGPPYVKVGAAIRYRRSEVEAWLAANRVEPAPTS